MQKDNSLWALPALLAQCLQFPIQCLKLSPSEDPLKKDSIRSGRVSFVEKSQVSLDNPTVNPSWSVFRDIEVTEDWGWGLSDSGLGSQAGPAGVDSERK